MNPARLMISSAASACTCDPVSRVARASASMTASSMARTAADDATGAPPALPVSAIAPDTAQSSTAQGSSIPHYRLDYRLARDHRCGAADPPRPAHRLYLDPVGFLPRWQRLRRCEPLPLAGVALQILCAAARRREEGLGRGEPGRQVPASHLRPGDNR